jgi:hypothetical protein
MNDPLVELLVITGFGVLPLAIAVWAYFLHRRPLVWAGITMLATPWFFVSVVVALALKGRSKTA